MLQIIDVVMFLLLLLVFILGYGIASQSLIRPYRPLSWGVISEVVSIPYWQMYGELLLDELKGESSHRKESLGSWTLPHMSDFFLAQWKRTQRAPWTIRRRRIARTIKSTSGLFPSCWGSISSSATFYSSIFSSPSSRERATHHMSLPQRVSHFKAWSVDIKQK